MSKPIRRRKVVRKRLSDPPTRKRLSDKSGIEVVREKRTRRDKHGNKLDEFLCIIENNSGDRVIHFYCQCNSFSSAYVRSVNYLIKLRGGALDWQMMKLERMSGKGL